MPLRQFAMIVCTLLMAAASLAQSTNLNQQAPGPAAPASMSSNDDSGNFGFGVKASSLGGGFEVAARVSHRSNLRAGMNFFSYGRTFHKDGVAYDGQLSFKTFEAQYDFFPFAGSFHVSPGLLAYIGDPITAKSSVPGGQSFTLGGTAFVSDPAAPVTGNGKINFNRAAPVITVGWGNLVPRSESKHFSIPFEFGVAFQGAPKTTLNLAGNVCDPSGFNCRPATDPVVQSAIASEQHKINNNLSLIKAYPIISIGIGYKF